MIRVSPSHNDPTEQLLSNVIKGRFLKSFNKSARQKAKYWVSFASNGDVDGSVQQSSEFRYPEKRDKT
jgi:hypothetical protein